MKKKAEKKLALGKIKIASLSKADQQALQGGAIKIPTLRTCVGCQQPPTWRPGCITDVAFCTWYNWENAI